MNIFKTLSIIALVSVVLVSCGGNKANETKTLSNPTTTEPNTETGNQNWDKLIDDYDKFVTDYIKLYKKVLKGDQSALTEYTTLMEKANILAESLEKAQKDNQLTTKQITRITEIATKMVNAATER